MAGKFIKGQSGNPSGKPSGNKSRQLLRDAITAELPEIIAVMVHLAKQGDVQAAKVLLDRALPVLKPQAEPVIFEIASNDSLADVGQTVLAGLSRGDITADTGNQLLTSLTSLVKIIETTELVQRIEALEHVIVKDPTEHT